MRLFSFANRPHQNHHHLPHVRVGVAHLFGPGKLHCEREHLVYETERTRQIRLDVEELEQIINYGEVSLSAAAMHLISRESISVTWLNLQGSTVCGRLAQDTSNRALTRLLQFHAWNDEQWQQTTAREIVTAKLQATQSALRHYQRQGYRLSEGVLKNFDRSVKSCEEATTVDQLRGIEGHGAATWYSEYGKLFRSGWKFAGRNRRPPRDPINAMLSLGYMQLYRRVTARIEASGLEASLGALHEFRSGRMSLACDLMEPLRIPAVDRWVFGLCQQGIIKPTDFDTSDSGVRLKQEKLGHLLGRFEEFWHQGLFRHILDDSVNSLVKSLREGVSQHAHRAGSAIKLRALREARRSGISEVYEP